MSAIPSSLTRAHIEAAVARIDREGVPPRRESTKFHLVVRGRPYPPKYVVSLAVAEATGRELSPHEFGGGDETNGVLRSLGFTVVGAPPSASSSRPRPQAEPPERSRPRAAVRSTPAKARRSEAHTIARVVVQGQPPSSPRAGSEALLRAFSRWPDDQRATFTVTPGGFLRGEFPARWTGGLGWDSRRQDLGALVRVAEPLVAGCLTPNVLATVARRTRVLTIGVDLMSNAEHAELVAVIDCETGAVIRWTGKSYPTSDQEATLVQVTDLSTHFLEIAGERVLVLGCHDLNMFSARGRANQNPPRRTTPSLRRHGAGDGTVCTHRRAPTPPQHGQPQHLADAVGVPRA